MEYRSNLSSKKANEMFGKFKKRINVKPIRRCCLLFAAIIAFAFLHPGAIAAWAQEDDPPTAAESDEQQNSNSDSREPIRGYPIRKRRIGGPTDVERDLDNSFPKQGSVLELILRCSESQEN